MKAGKQAGAQPFREELPMKLPKLEPSQHNLMVQESVLQQLANPRSHEEIRSRLGAGNLLLHGWVRDDESVAIHVYDAKTGQFVN